jgi:tRNA/rRNA methyltransferase
VTQAAPAEPSTQAPLVLVLVEPAGPLNVGSVARLCANFGVGQLRLVAPRCDHLGEEARRMAVHAADLLERATLHPDLAAAIADCHRVVATSGRQDPEPLPVVGPEDALRWMRAAQPETPSALVFGREDRGLTNDELLQTGRVLRLASDPAYPSLNLSHAVAITLHELRRSPGRTMQMQGTATEPVARGALEATLADAEDLLLEVGFLLPHTAHARMAKLRALLQRAVISAGEIALLRGMVRQLRWASRRRTP